MRKKLTIQKHPTSWGNSVDRLSLNEPLSNFDLYDLIKELNIENFIGVFSRDNLPFRNLTKLSMKNWSCIVDLDSKTGPGTHWVAFRHIKDAHCEYFDSYGLPPPNEIIKFADELDKKNTKFTYIVVQP